MAFALPFAPHEWARFQVSVDNVLKLMKVVDAVDHSVLLETFYSPGFLDITFFWFSVFPLGCTFYASLQFPCFSLFLNLECSKFSPWFHSLSVSAAMATSSSNMTLNIISTYDLKKKKDIIYLDLSSKLKTHISNGLCIPPLGYLLDISPLTFPRLKMLPFLPKPTLQRTFPISDQCQFHHFRCSSQNSWRQPSFLSFIIHNKLSANPTGLICRI